MSHAGIQADQAKRAANLKRVAERSDIKLCDWCGGTGNELYAMYRRCPICNGNGFLQVTEEEVSE